MAFDRCYCNGEGVVRWEGQNLRQTPAAACFLTGPVEERFSDGTATGDFHRHLRELPKTGMGKENLEKALSIPSPNKPAWAAGEAVAEALLNKHRGVVFPWNTDRDKRNAKASLPGADIIGFLPSGDTCRLVLGEVKTSQEEKFPPGVVNGPGGLRCQIKTLAFDSRLVLDLFEYLYWRVKGLFLVYYRLAATGYYDNNDVALFGILIRDTRPDCRDLQQCGMELSKSLAAPTSCDLIAVYLPWSISQLPDKILASTNP